MWFAVAITPLGLVGARALLGLGSSCYLMAPLAFYARRFPPSRFGLFTGIQLGLGTLGTLFATAPLAWSAAVGGGTPGAPWDPRACTPRRTAARESEH